MRAWSPSCMLVRHKEGARRVDCLYGPLVTAGRRLLLRGPLYVLPSVPGLGRGWEGFVIHDSCVTILLPSTRTYLTHNSAVGDCGAWLMGLLSHVITSFPPGFA